MAPIIITGGAGYIGSVIAASLAGQGREILVIDRRPSPHFPHVVADLREEDLRTHLLGAEAIIHLAAHSIVSTSISEPHRTWAENLIATHSLLEWAESVPIIHSSTAAVYGSGSGQPLREEDLTIPEHAYGRSKLAVETMLTDHVRANGAGAISLRFFNVAGAMRHRSLWLGEHHDTETHLIPNLITAASTRNPVTLHGDQWPTSDGTNIRDYVHVLDLAEAHLAALDLLLRQGIRGHTSVNIGSGRGYTNREVIHAVEEVTGKDVPLVIGAPRQGDPAALTANIDRAAQLLGWRPTRTLHEMVLDAWQASTR